MRRLQAWILARGHEAERRALLEDSLLCGTLPRYARYRLGVFSVAQLVSFFVYLVEFRFLRFIFAQRHLVTALWLLNAGALVTGFWWGALELARARVRARPKDTSRELTPWFHTAILLGAVPFAVALAETARKVFLEHGVFSVFDLWALAFLLRLWVDLVAQTLYAGAYAVRRVYRPLWIPPVLRALSFAVILALWPWLGPWSFSLGFLAAGLVSSGVAWRYAIATYRQLRVAPPRFGEWTHAWQSWRFSFSGLRYACSAGFASASLRLSATLVFVFFFAFGVTGAVHLGVAFHLMGPLLGATGSWAQTFYFDWKRLDPVIMATFRARFDRFLANLAWSSGLACWALAVPVLCIFVRRGGVVLALLLLPVFLLRARIAVLQIKYFAEDRFGWLTGSTTATLALFAVCVWLWRGSSFEWVGIAAPLVLGGLLSAQLMLLVAQDRPAKPGGGPTRSMAEWAASLAAVSEPVVVGVAEVADRSRGTAKKVAEALLPNIGDKVALGDGARLLWHAPPHAETDTELRVTLLTESAGLLTDVRFLPRAESGREALRSALTEGLIDRGSPSVENLVERFERQFPGGLVVDVQGERFPAALREAPLNERRDVWNEAKQFALDVPRAKRRSRFDVSVYAPSGRIEAIFLLGRALPPDDRRIWREHVRSATLAATLRSARVAEDTTAE